MRPLAILYLALAVVGLVGTWYFNIVYIASPADPASGNGNYIASWFVNAGSSSAAVDVGVTALAANVFFVVEGRRLGWGWKAWLFLPLTFLVALAFAAPLFLAVREIALGRNTTSAETPRQR
ncbi:DUF2834 domain-containing protein [Microbacteriaceae bacterium VKM Ac-2854]|nr:DUF2834 domain-containing protein [Microbacteriaceae bacterium VKM Ac-2854]